MIRAATIEDIPHIVDMGKRFIGETHYADHIAQNSDTIESLVTRMIGSEDCLLLVYGNPPTGMLGAVLFEHPISGEVVASEMFWWTEPETRGSGVRLLKSAEKWATDKGARKFMMIAPNSRVGEFYSRVGYTQIETTYMRSL